MSQATISHVIRVGGDYKQVAPERRAVEIRWRRRTRARLRRKGLPEPFEQAARESARGKGGLAVSRRVSRRSRRQWLRAKRACAPAAVFSP